MHRPFRVISWVTHSLAVALPILSFLSFPMTSPPAQAGPDPRIVGGRAAAPGDWPWMTVLVYAGVTPYTRAHFCGGGLIHERMVVTAAHCVSQKSPDAILAVVGITDLTGDGGESLRVERITVHPDYDRYTFESDIALLTLADKATATPLSPFEGADTLESATAVVMGWGRTDPALYAYSDILLQASLPVIGNATCNIAFNAFNSSYYHDPISANMLCAGPAEGGVDACTGDSGGPLVVYRDDAWRLAGIVSWGEGCAEPGLYGVYTRVSRFADFIREHLPPTLTVPGDLDGDGRLGLPDVIRILRGTAELDGFTPEEWSAGDATGDGETDLRDAVFALIVLAGGN